MTTTLSASTSQSRTWGWRPCSRRGTSTTTLSTSRLTSSLLKIHFKSYWGNHFRAREHMLKPMRLLLRHMLTLSHGMIPSKLPGKTKFMPKIVPIPCPFARAAKTIPLFPGTLTWSQRSSRISLGSHLETNHSLYSVALNVLNLS